jgi:acetolactate synthase-1/2/3 large subunit
MKLSDYVLSFLIKKGVGTAFYLAGGGMMHLMDSLGSSSVNAVALLHEQAVAVACEAYANTKGVPGVAFVTTGPGGTNAITGVLAAYLDSSPCFILSGQVKTADLKSNYGVRSLGSQEADIISMVSAITKYSAMVTDPLSIRIHLERAWYEMTSGRKGPVWLDIPLDIQSAQIEPEDLQGYAISEASHSAVDVSVIINALNKSIRPVIIAGNGLAEYKPLFHELINYLQIPVIPTWKAMDYIPNAHPLYAGRAGGMGDRYGNLTMQNADLILSLGSRLDFSITGYDRTEWAPNAIKIVVDIDPAEIEKLETASKIIPIITDVGAVCDSLLKRNKEIQLNDLTEWKKIIANWQKRYPIITSEKYTTPSGTLTTYAFVDTLCRILPEGAYIAPCSAGTTAEIFFQACTIKPGQTIRSNHGLGSMGFEIPNAIGMCIAGSGKPVVCIAGDGGMQLNIQELAVVRGRNLPVKLFVINNNGYASIRNMQNNHFNGRHLGCDAAHGLNLPELKNLAMAYNLPYLYADTADKLEKTVAAVLQADGPVLCEIVVDAECLVSPRTATRVMPDGSLRSSPLENQFPFLPDEEMEKILSNSF